MIHIDAQHQGLIGDALAAVPYMKYLCDKHSSRAFVTGFNRSVQPLLGDYPFVFSEPDLPIAESGRFLLNLPDAWQHDMRHGWPWHMAQCYFAFNGEPVPPLPACYPMHSEPCGMEPGIALTPFSRTNAPDNNKLWPHDRWETVIRHLMARGYADQAYVLGSIEDDCSPYLGIPGVTAVVDGPLTKVLDLLRTSKVVLGVDNGISNLCHFGGVGRHVMIYADCLPPLFAENPLGIHVRGKMPATIPPESVIGAAEAVLTGKWPVT